MGNKITLVLLSLILLSMAVLLAYAAGSTRPKPTNPLIPYITGDYAVGAPVGRGLYELPCQHYRDEYIYGAKTYYFYCKPDNPLIRAVMVFPNEFNNIETVYIALTPKMVSAGDLVLWFHATVELRYRGVRRLSWTDYGSGSTWCWCTGKRRFGWPLQYVNFLTFGRGY